MAAPDPDRQCPHCGTPYAEDQEYCLQCGGRLPGRGSLVAALGTAWRRRMGWYPGDWIWPALLALVIAAAAGTASALWLADSSSAGESTLVETSPRATSIQQTQTAPEPTTPATTTTATQAAPPPPPPPPPPDQPTKWPAGRSGWTVVLDSLPAGSRRAYIEARQALRKGMKKVGVLNSSSYSSLHPGYLVVFAGIYESEADAQGALLDAHEHGYGGAYPRRITP